MLLATIPFFATSSAIVLVMAETAPLDAVYPAVLHELCARKKLLLRTD